MTVTVHVLIVQLPISPNTKPSLLSCEPWCVQCLRRLTAIYHYCGRLALSEVIHFSSAAANPLRNGLVLLQFSSDSQKKICSIRFLTLTHLGAHIYIASFCMQPYSNVPNGFFHNWLFRTRCIFRIEIVEL